MELNFKIQGDRLIAGSVLEGNSGNVGTYICNFDILDNKGYMWLCVFKKGDTAYKQVIKQGKCVIPHEVLETCGNIQIGCYGVWDNVRVSTNWLTFDVAEGAYSNATVPQEPTPDVWEELMLKTLPYIGESGNWFTYDIEKETYVDSGVSAIKTYEPKMELLYDGTVAEEVSTISVTTDKDGNNFELDELYAVVKIPSPNNLNPYIYFTPGTACFTSVGALGTSNSTLIISWKRGYLCAKIEQYQYYNSFKKANIVNITDDIAVNQFRMCVFGDTVFPVGTEIKVWGRKVEE
ncbi:MAG: hypothetical protein IJ304_00275 [Clostridia bacterium]|nr:hypothetical protein [Clostridia bacterium]